MRKVARKNFVELLIVLHILEVHLDINDVIHRESRRFNDLPDAVETLTYLSRKISGSGSAAVRALTGDIHVVAGVETVWSEMS